MMNGLVERIDKGVLQWRVISLLRVCMECVLVVAHWLRPRKRWIDAVKDCLRKRFGCEVSVEDGAGQERMVGECMGRSPMDGPDLNGIP